jgi:hypothetical protein
MVLRLVLREALTAARPLVRIPETMRTFAQALKSGVETNAMNGALTDVLT